MSVSSHQQSPTTENQPSTDPQEINVFSLKHPLVILTKNPKSGWKCPYARCNHENQGLVGSLKHMWKFKSRNACNKKCIGRHQPNILQIYPKLMSKSLHDMNEYFSGEFPDYDWTAIHKLISKNSKTHQTLDFQSLMIKHQIYIHFPIMVHENFSADTIPAHLQKYIIYDFKHFEEKYETYEEDDDDDDIQSINTSVISSSDSSSNASSSSNSNTSHFDPSSINFTEEPPLKRKKIDQNTAQKENINNSIFKRMDVSGLNLPVLFPNAFPFQFSNKYSPTMNKIHPQLLTSSMGKRNPLHSPLNKNRRKLNKKSKKYSIGPRCASCQTTLNPCDCMVECNECKPETILCFNCFTNGKEFQAHKRFHRYSILEPIQPESQGSKWNVRNEWNLLKSIRKFGIGNWMAITEYMKINSNDNLCKFNVNRCTKYYYQHLNANDDQLYNHVINDPMMAGMENEIEVNENTENTENNVRRRGRPPNISGPMSEFFPIQIREKLGYKIHRNEFEAEWKNSAESMIADMYFNENDTQSERNIKIEGLHLYNNVLQQRIKRRDFIFKYGVYYGKSRKSSREFGNLENEIFNNMSSFALFAENKKEFKELVNGLIDEKQLREDIYLLKKYLLNGVSNINDVKLIENFIKKQYILKEEKEKKKVKGVLDSANPISVRCLNDEQKSNPTFLMNIYIGCSLETISVYLQANYNQRNTKKHRRRSMMVDYNNIFGEDKDSEIVKTSEIKSEKVDGERDISGMVGYEELSESEKRFCEILNVSPADYSLIEDEISRRVYIHGLLKPEQIPQQLHVEIGDVENVAGSMKIKVGIVEPVSLPSQVTYNPLPS